MTPGPTVRIVRIAYVHYSCAKRRARQSTRFRHPFVRVRRVRIGENENERTTEGKANF